MKIVVCIKAVPGFITNPRIAEGQNRVEYEAGTLILNESDDYALEEGIKLAKQTSGEVTVMTVGSLSSQKALQIGLGKDAHHAVRINANLTEPIKIAQAIAAAIRDREVDLILTGVESRDNMAAQVGVSIAALLDLPFEYAVTKIEPGENKRTMTITKELGFGLKQKVEVALPALLCIQTGDQPPGFVPVRKLMMAQSKPIDTISPGDLNLEEAFLTRASVELVDVFFPKESAKAHIIHGKPSEVASVLMKKVKEAS